MIRYSYSAKNSKGRHVSGTLEAVSLSSLFEALESKNLIPIKVEEINFDGTRKNETLLEQLKTSFIAMNERVPYKDVVFFTRQLATMISGGVTITRALEQLAKSEKGKFQEIIYSVVDNIAVGNTFSDSLAKHPGAFNRMYVSIVRSGEVTGSMEQVLEDMADYMENNEALKAKVKSALNYPLFISGFVTIIVIGIMWKLVPVFEDMYSGMNATLPAPTQILISVSQVIQNNIIIVFILLTLSIILFKYLLGVKGFRRVFDRYVLKVPVFGEILNKNILAIYSRTMGLLLGSGTPILEAIQISSSVVGNMLYSEKLDEVYRDLQRGDLLSEAMLKSKVFPPLVIQMISTGEECGTIDTLLHKVAQFYERDIRNTVNSISSIIEPFLIVTIGSVVGAILIALYMPIFMMGRVLR